MANSTFWQTAGMRATLELLAARVGPMPRNEVMASLRERLAPDGVDVEVQSNKHERWWSYIAWGTSYLVAAEWMIKDGSGVWSITDKGRAALQQYVDPNELRRVAVKAYRDARADAAEQATRRAWLVRGSSVLGVNLVPQWLVDGWCSLAASQLPAIEATIERDTLIAIADAAYEHLKVQERRSKVNEIADFVCKMKVGDVLLTTSDDGVFIGDVKGEWEYQPSESGRSNLRRDVSWRNADAGVDFGDLPGALQAKLKTGDTIADITGELVSIEDLTLDPTDGVELPATEARQPHIEFGKLAASVAADLFLSEPWLAEFVELLNEKRQIVLYGPPGTGKTFLARRIAAHLVGEQQVRLVQFHPSYTYEDFFEGFRPSPGAAQGTVSLELRAGPLRRLATEAKEHLDQAFILVIDELNRANIAKVFGELYFLLEYRDQGVEVLYGGEPFTLPTNLYFVCTMNTADRSIALLDAAMRRRFAFVELHPATQPTESMLRDWLARKELPPTAGALLGLLNAAIEDRDAHIGPSYFMTSDQSKERLARIWRTQIVPLLQETHYDRWTSTSSRFDFEALYGKAIAQLDAPA
ncbi:MAG: AAA family ATPase [Actinomycetota bacterium]|nr:AAA family ATPase [Actinomycetota bacterium]